jgi:DNA-directed RNA polymerase subunit M/transcription elongation factor TFIIS
MNRFKNFREVVRGLKRRNISPKFCPKCGNLLQLSSGIAPHPKWYGFVPVQYVCEKCGYKGTIAMEKEDENSDLP